AGSNQRAAMEIAWSDVTWPSGAAALGVAVKMVASTRRTRVLMASSLSDRRWSDLHVRVRPTSPVDCDHFDPEPYVVDRHRLRVRDLPYRAIPRARRSWLSFR